MWCSWSTMVPGQNPPPSHCGLLHHHRSAAASTETLGTILCDLFRTTALLMIKQMLLKIHKDDNRHGRHNNTKCNASGHARSIRMKSWFSKMSFRTLTKANSPMISSHIESQWRIICATSQGRRTGDGAGTSSGLHGTGAVRGPGSSVPTGFLRRAASAFEIGPGFLGTSADRGTFIRHVRAAAISTALRVAALGD